jgi:hypothetical protein
MKFSRAILSGMSIVGIVAVAVSCGRMSGRKSDSGDGASIPPAGGNGCVFGSVVNGLTGELISVRAFDGNQGLSVLVRNQLYGAGEITGSQNRDMVDGSYSICGIPTDEDYAFFASIEGYQSFSGTVHIDSTAPTKSPNAETHLFKGSPAQEANIVLYPRGTKTQDLKITVVYNATPVKGATVQLRPTGRNALDAANAKVEGFDSKILAPRDIRLRPLTATTNENGIATFSKDDVVLGGVYGYLALPPETLTTASTEFDATGTVVVGLQTGTTAKDPYHYVAALRAMAPDLAIVQTSTQTNTISPDGSVTIVFNRPIEIVSQPDSMIATLTNAVDAELVPEINGNRASETMAIVLSNDNTMLRLTPNFRTSPVSAHEPALVVNYAGIQVRPASAPNNAKVLAVPTQSVKLFGLDTNPTLIASKLQKVGDGDNQRAPVSTVLSTNLSVTVIDQFGLPLKNQQVTFQVTSGNGTVKRPIDAAFATSVIATTDVNGTATVTWTLGTIVGEQTLQAKVGTLETVVFRATGTN